MSSLKVKRSSRTPEANITATEPANLVVGWIVAINNDGTPLVDFAENPANSPVLALATARYDVKHLGAAVALMFLDGDRARPFAIGTVPQANSCGKAPASVSGTPAETTRLTAANELVLECGRSSIVLTRAGKVLIRGTYLSSRSSGMHRITGASVQIN